MCIRDRLILRLAQSTTYPLPGQGLDVVHLGRTDTQLFGSVQHRMGDGVFRAGLHPGRQTKEFLGLSTVKSFAVRSKNLHHGHDGTGEGAGLVHDDGVDALGTLQCLGPTDEHPHAGTAPGPGEQRQWGGESQRTRAGDDEHRDGRGESR